MKKTIFICMEGGEAVGKSTQIKLIEKAMINSGLSVLKTREPGGIRTCENIRNIVLFDAMDQITELLLFSASRHENIKEVIIPGFGKYDVIITDRFILSTLVYQGKVGGIPINNIIVLHETFNFNLYPDMTLILDDDVNIVMDRLSKRSDINIGKNKIDEKPLIFHTKVLAGFRTYYDVYKGCANLIDCRYKRVIDVHEKIIGVINKKFGLNIIPLRS